MFCTEQVIDQLQPDTTVEVPFAFGAVDDDGEVLDDDDEAIAIGRAAVKAMKKAGLTVRWSRSATEPIVVELRWEPKLPAFDSVDSVYSDDDSAGPSEAERAARARREATYDPDTSTQLRSYVEHDGQFWEGQVRRSTYRFRTGAVGETPPGWTTKKHRELFNAVAALDTGLTERLDAGWSRPPGTPVAPVEW
ncbi:DUF6891 domain-containing protein [Nakamurella aerolata]|uniref:DUF6891 domain-containing protein n=1 Tax=Nakamurella aerolata TaxID=1656892 RepID=UPI003CCD35E2